MKEAEKKPPNFPHALGRMEIDYRNHDGQALLGLPPWAFRTAWSTAGPGSIHAYGGGAVSIAIARGVDRIELISADVVAQSDFTSRTRTPSVGQVLLLRNESGYLAAIEIEKVTVAPDGEPGSVLTARYKIMTDGSQDFSAETVSPDQELRAAAAEALDALPPPAEDASSAAPRMGHNNPPQGDALTPEERQELQRALGELATGTVSRTSAPAEKSRIRRAIDRGLDLVTSYWRMTTKQLAEEANKALGSLILAALVAWSGFMDQLQKVWALLNALF